MEIKNGTQTSEFKLSVVSNVVTAVIALLIAYGVLTADEAQLWQVLVMAVIALVTPLAGAIVSKEYTLSRTALKMEAMQPGKSELTIITPNIEFEIEDDIGDLQPGAASHRPEAAE